MGLLDPPALIRATADPRYARRFRRFGLESQALPTVMTATAPTVTVGTANAGLTISPNVQIPLTNTAKLRVLGAHVSINSSDTSFYTSDTLSPVNGNSFQPWAIEFWSDSAAWIAEVRGVANTYRIWQDDQLVASGVSTTPSGGAYYEIKVAPSGGRAWHKWRFEMDTGRVVYVAFSPTDSVVATPAPTRRLAVLGDSYTEGTGATSRMSAFPQTLGRLLGCGETIQSGSGGTGYLAVPVNSGGTINRLKYRDRITNDVLSLAPDIVLVTGGRNDYATYTASQVGTEAALLFAAIRSALPNAQLAASAPFNATTTEATQLSAIGTAISTAVVAAGGVYLDLLTPGFLTGTGKAGATTSDGNADFMISSDGVHPTQAGHDLWARVLADLLTAQLATA